MLNEELILRPTGGAVDRDAITAWLASKDYAFLDPIEGRCWHLSASKDEMQRSRAARLADPSQFPSGVIVQVSPDAISVSAYLAGKREDARALELIHWIARNGNWTVQRDQSPPEPLGDAARLFAEGVGEPDYIHGELTDGARYTWEVGARSFIVHTSGQWRTVLTDTVETWRKLEAWKGVLSSSAMAEWKAAVAVAYQTGELIEFVEGDTATGTFTIENEDGTETAYFDAVNVPDSLKPIAALVERWINELAHWTKSSTSADLRRAWRD